MKKLLALILAALMLLAMVPAMADADTSLDDLLAKGTLVLGLDDTFAPMGFRDPDTNEIVGFDVDLATKVCEILGVELVLQPIDWDSKEMELASGNVDCLWNGFSINDERLASMAMTEAYMNNAMALVSSDPECLTVEQLAGKVLGVQAASYAEEMMFSEDWADFYGSLADMVSFPEYATAFLDLANGNLNAILVDRVYAGYTTANLDGEYYIGEDLEDDLYAVGFRLGANALRDKVNEILTQLKEDGTMAELSIKWLGEDFIYYGE